MNLHVPSYLTNQVVVREVHDEAQFAKAIYREPVPFKLLLETTLCEVQVADSPTSGSACKSHLKSSHIPLNGFRSDAVVGLGELRSHFFRWQHSLASELQRYFNAF